MNWLKTLKKKMAENKERAVVNRYKYASLAKQCMECKHFVYREEKPRNWVCRCPNEQLRFQGSVCLGWEYGAHPEMIVFNSR